AVAVLAACPAHRADRDQGGRHRHVRVDVVELLVVARFPVAAGGTVERKQGPLASNGADSGNCTCAVEVPLPIRASPQTLIACAGGLASIWPREQVGNPVVSRLMCLSTSNCVLRAGGM